MFRLLLCVVFITACGRNGGGDDGGGDAGDVSLEGLTTITVKPENQTLIIEQGAAATSAYAALGTFDDGRIEDITPYVQFTLDDGSLGGFTAADLTTTTTHGGQTQVRAAAYGVEGTTGVTVKLVQTWTDPGSTSLPGNPGGLFGGAVDPARAPALVYPNDGVVLPPNLGKLEFHFRPGAGNTVFELALANTVLDLKIYLACTQPLNGGCIYLPDPQAWKWLAESNRGGEPVTWSIRATDDTGTGVGSTGTMSLAFSLEDVTGGIYYWTTTLQAIMRFDFASQTQTVAERFIGTEATGGTCMGCHALSRDGTKMVAESGGQNDGRLVVIDVATKTPLVPYASGDRSIFESWAPDGNTFVGVYGDNGATNFDLMIFNGATGSVTETIPAGGSSTNPTNHPDWSPLGDRIVYTNVGTKNTLQMMYNSEIRTVARVNDAWQPWTVLVPRANGKNRYYPAWAPDGQKVVFNESTCTNGNTGGECNGDTDPSAKLYMIDGINGGTITPLAKADSPGIADGTTTNLTDSFPKWNPLVFSRSKSGGRMSWLTFSSTRKYGLRNPPGNGTLLWMVAVDLDAPAGTDPSATAFALPFQDLATSNHIAQWTTKVVGPIH